MYCGDRIKFQRQRRNPTAPSRRNPTAPYLSLFLSRFCDPQYRGKKKSNSSDHDGTPPLPPDEPPLLPLSVFLSRFRDRYLGETQHEEDLKKFWSSGEEVLDSSEDEIEEILADEGHEEIFCEVDEEYYRRKRDPNRPSYRRRRIQKAKDIVKEFIDQVENHKYAEFNWPPDPECLTFKCYVLNYYLEKWFFEDEKYENDEKFKVPKLFLEQVRSSWGYAVTVGAPGWLRSHFLRVSLHSESGWRYHGRTVVTGVTCAVKRINAGAKEKGKTYFPVKILNAVEVPPCVMLLTLVLKEVDSGVYITVRAGVTFPVARNTRKPELEECKLIPTPVPVPELEDCKLIPTHVPVPVPELQECTHTITKKRKKHDVDKLKTSRNPTR